MSFTKWFVKVPGVTYNSRGGVLPKNSPMPFDEFVGTREEAEAAGYTVVGGGAQFEGSMSPGLHSSQIEPTDYLQMYGGDAGQ